ncbi:MAG: phosphatase PAP2 family protein [Clostridium sp.]|nr:phosphatase PAP2 family protein [Clostridium sp.]
MNHHKNHYTTAVTLAVVFVLLTVALLIVDVQPIGPMESHVGFAALNGFISRTFPESQFWNTVAKVLGILLLLIAAFFAGLGAKQLYERRSIRRVDYDLLALGAVYGADLILYVLFEKLVINYRPVLEDGELAASYPSSHTLLAVTIGLTAIVEVQLRVRDMQKQQLLRILLAVLMIATICAKLLAGVHWFTDIIASIILGTSISLAYLDVVD